MNAVEPKDTPLLSLEKLQKAIPEIDWTKGHSGELLSEEVVEKLNDLTLMSLNNFVFLQRNL